MPLIKKAYMYIMLTNDKLFEETVNFYKNMGLTPKLHVKKNWAEFDLGNILLGICPTSQEYPDRCTGIVMEVDDLQKIYEKNKDSMTFMSEPVEAIHGIMVSVKDPAGNIFDLYQPTHEKVRDLARKISEKECCGCCCGSDDCKDTCK